ncbi:hypothetical protein, partial [Micromonospora sp. KC721]|uniref:hypothetical protein n=1 Tax=Micromonospora sp. KC721 TaxID=2530380 RepID=UPI0014048F33
AYLLPHTWYRLADIPGAQSAVLDAVESDGWEGLIRVLVGYRVEHRRLSAGNVGQAVPGVRQEVGHGVAADLFGRNLFVGLLVDVGQEQCPQSTRPAQRALTGGGPLVLVPEIEVS